MLLRYIYYKEFVTLFLCLLILFNIKPIPFMFHIKSLLKFVLSNTCEQANTKVNKFIILSQRIHIVIL